MEAQCRWLANQVVGVDFILNDSSNALSSQTNELAASMNGRIIIIKKNYKIIKDTHTDFQEKYFLNNDVLRIMEGREERIVNEEGDYIEIMCPIYSAGSEDGEVFGAVIATVPRDGSRYRDGAAEKYASGGFHHCRTYFFCDFKLSADQRLEKDTA